ncbi:FAD-dependent 5-carboxymethylaminomethyl-2-thiouridine(34) oxidoreductase MnmC [Shewanella sp. OMA3-2]|uniref:FAD-dependent 5-carboxymethylaminomethyl-2-thiouridine(34) oxidoreductase MnmC n=1 Tax=Shewanella sp. OMA3-2 TaxID=2908650 RepID=UPI001F239FE9|nr:FAD-dependent 5-carboxymethylaminomethyl-2-thiouridine(34) oxidoreductase MnmC [Shewanella sp. OMA3-2]UJF23273.1 FAD-dependent 5-carboxymethylaminomethyl-2-thiouridine(34) oxidoreductase MnmC [Shewanella sp. OMA3-2]
MSKSTNLFMVNHYQHYLQRVIKQPDTATKLIHVGHLGLAEPTHINDLIDAFTQLKQTCPAWQHCRLHVSLFTYHSKEQQAEFNAFILHFKQILHDFIADIAVAPIKGCQRINIQDDITLDCHFSRSELQLSSLANIHHKVHHWYACSDTMTPLLRDHFYQATNVWQLGRLSHDNSAISIYDRPIANKDPLFSSLQTTVAQAGFQLLTEQPTDSITKHLTRQATGQTTSTSTIDIIACQERHALRHQQQNSFAYQGPLTPALIEQPIGIIGGGIASTSLALSLAERGKSVVLYCQDDAIGQGASGNRQGAIYPLLTPENDALSQFYQQAFLYSRQRVQRLTSQGYEVSHDFCGVLHTGFDDRSKARLNKIINGQEWPDDIARKVSADQASDIARVEIKQTGLFYPLGGWICPYELAQASLDHAVAIGSITIKMNCKIESIEQTEQGWALCATEQKSSQQKPNQQKNSQKKNSQQGSPIAFHPQLVIANGADLTHFQQTREIPLSGFRGQVSHVPSKGELASLKTVICANGYLTLVFQQQHCVGASYVKSPQHLDFCPIEQVENGKKMSQSFANVSWPNDINVSGNDARVGVRMVSRDHFPVMGYAIDMEKLNQGYQIQQASKDKPSLWQQHWQTTPAPIHDGLFVLGGFGSRGLSSAPLVAECLAANLCGEIMPINLETQTLLSPNRMWMRKLLKGKAI